MAIRKRKPGDPLSIYASEWNALADLSQPAVAQLRGPLGFAAQAVTVLVQNLTGVDLDRYYCIGLGQPLWSLQADGSTDLILAGLAADPLKPVGILAEPIANTLFGRVWIHGLAYAAVGPGAGISATPAATGNRLTPGPGSVRLLGSPSPSTELLLPVLLGWSNVEGLGIAGTGGIPSRTTSTVPHTFPTGTVNLLDPESGNYYTPNRSIIVSNSTRIQVPEGDIVQWKQVGSKFWIDVDDCP